MRPIFSMTLLLAVALTGGCASTEQSSVPLTTVTEYGPGSYRAVAASALVFDPPIALEEPPVELARGPRQPGAFFGYDEGSVEYYRLYVDDRQTFGFQPGWRRGGGGGWGYGGGSGGGWQDRYERRATSERIGVIRR